MKKSNKFSEKIYAFNRNWPEGEELIKSRNQFGFFTKLYN